MKTAWQANAIETKPDLTALASFGFPTNGDRAKGISATQPGAAWYYLMSLVRDQLIDAVGDTPDWTDESQYLKSLKKIASIINDKSIVGKKLADETIDTGKLAKVATLADLYSGTADAIVTAEILKQYIYESICPVGTCQCFLAKQPPKGWLELDGSQITQEDAPELMARLFQFESTKGDSSTYAVLPNMRGRVFQGAASVEQVALYLEGKLPNITGHSRFVAIGDNWPILSDAYGTFSGSNEIQNNGASVTRSSTPVETNSSLNFNSKYSSSIFQDGATVQPNALQVLACVRC